MKRKLMALLVAGTLAAPMARGAPEVTTAAPAAGGELRVAARDTLRLPYPNVMAVFAVDPSIVEVSTQAGELVLHGRRAGVTHVTVILPAGVQTLTVAVDAPVLLAPAFGSGVSRQANTLETRYDSGQRRLGTALSARFGEGEQTALLRVEGLHDQSRNGLPGHTALPFASLQVNTPGRTLTLLDQYVRSSPLTLNETMLRGVHLRQGIMEFHAGVASDTRYSDLLIPGNGDRAVGLSLHVPQDNLRWQPSVLMLPDSTGGAKGVVALGAERGQAADPVHLRGEIGWGGRPGASFDLDWRQPRRQAWVRGRVQPDGFATMKIGHAPGHYLDSAWTETVTTDTTATFSGSVTRLDTAQLESRSGSARVDLRHQLADHWSTTGSVGTGEYRSNQSSLLRRGTASLGLSHDRSAWGWSAVYRYQTVSGASTAGHGGRVSVRGRTADGWRSNLFIDAQQQAVTRDLILQDRTDISRALTELGINATNPDDLVRLLSDNAALLASRGVAVGPLELNPLRMQTGLDVAWRSPGAWGPELGLRAIVDEVKGVASQRRSLIGTLYANWRLQGHTDIGLGYSRWSTQRNQDPRDTRYAFQVSLRTTFDKLALPGAGSHAITGRVTVEAAASDEPLAGIEVVLDRNRRTRTDAAGRFSFESPGAGMHRIEAVLPVSAEAYFTSPSIQTVQAGAQADFALSFSAARLTGVVTTETGLPLEGVAVRLAGHAQATTTTDSAGAYRFAVPAGSGTVELVAESLPAGYELGALVPAPVQLAQGAPARADFAIQTQRSVQGVVEGLAGTRATVRVLETGREAGTDTAGRFVLVGLPAGPVTLQVRSSLGESRHVLDLPPQPAVLRDITLKHADASRRATLARK